MDKLKLKVGRNIIDIDEDDIVMDNGSCVQVITREIGTGWNKYSPLMSKSLFSKLKKVGYLYTNKELEEYSKQRYSGTVTLYRFDIDQMSKSEEYK